MVCSLMNVASRQYCLVKLMRMHFLRRNTILRVGLSGGELDYCSVGKKKRPAWDLNGRILLLFLVGWEELGDSHLAPSTVS